MDKNFQKFHFLNLKNFALIFYSPFFCLIEYEVPNYTPIKDFLSFDGNFAFEK